MWDVICDQKFFSRFSVPPSQISHLLLLRDLCGFDEPLGGCNGGFLSDWCDTR